MIKSETCLYLKSFVKCQETGLSNTKSVKDICSHEIAQNIGVKQNAISSIGEFFQKFLSTGRLKWQKEKNWNLSAA